MKPLFHWVQPRQRFSPGSKHPAALAVRGGRTASMLCFSTLTILLVLGLPRTVSASPYLAEMHLDWQQGTMAAVVELDLAASGIRLPSGRSEAERSIASKASDLVRESILSILVDSYRTVNHSLDDRSIDPEAFRDFIESGKRLNTVLSSDMARMRATYQWNLAELAGLYVRHTIPTALPEADRFVPTRAYTGIVIYVQGEYAVRGEHRLGRMIPSLFPRIYDDEMNPILSRNHVDPAALRSGGIAAFARGLDDPVVERRAGDDPLRIMAYQIFGTLRTDLIITRTDALKILGHPVNRDLIRTGRVVFILDL